MHTYERLSVDYTLWSRERRELVWDGETSPMTFQEFAAFQKKLFEDCIQMCDTKGLEYTSGKDRFENFNDAATDMDVPRLKVAEIFLDKHMRAIESYIRTGKSYSTEPIRGRFVDAIVYLTLIAGMVEEDITNA